MSSHTEKLAAVAMVKVAKAKWLKMWDAGKLGGLSKENLAYMGLAPGDDMLAALQKAHPLSSGNASAREGFSFLPWRRHQATRYARMNNRAQTAVLPNQLVMTPIGSGVRPALIQPHVSPHNKQVLKHRSNVADEWASIVGDRLSGSYFQPLASLKGGLKPAITTPKYQRAERVGDLRLPPEVTRRHELGHWSANVSGPGQSILESRNRVRKYLATLMAHAPDQATKNILFRNFNGDSTLGDEVLAQLNASKGQSAAAKRFRDAYLRPYPKRDGGRSVLSNFRPFEGDTSAVVASHLKNNYYLEDLLNSALLWGS